MPGKVGVRDWFFEHFPLHPILLVFLAAAFWRACRWVVAERVRYLGGLRRRMRGYQRRDLERLRRTTEAPDATPPA